MPQWLTLGTVRPSAFRLPPVPPVAGACRPSPCGRLSRPPTTMAAPSPLGLAPRRRSRGTSSSYVRDRRRCPTHPLHRPHWPSSRRARVSRPTVHAATRGGSGNQAPLPLGVHLHHWGLGFRQSGLHPIGRVKRGLPCSAFRQPRLRPSMLWSRWPFGRWSAGSPRTSLESFLAAPGMCWRASRRTPCMHVSAHTALQCFVPGALPRRPSGVDGRVAGAADDQGLASPGSHRLLPV